MQIYFDIDGTLIDIYDQPRDDILAMLKTLAKYHDIILWSGSGKDYAEMWSRRLFINNIVKECRAKEKLSPPPELTFDDEKITLGIVNIKV